MDSSTGKSNAGTPCEFTQNLEILRQIEFFAGLPLETLKVFAYLLVREGFSAGDYLYSQDDEDGRAFFILEGALALVRDMDGEELSINRFATGDFVGGLSLLSPMRHLFSLKAMQDTECLVLEREKFTKAIAQFPELIPRIFRSVADTIRDWDRQRLFEMHEKGLSLEGVVGISAI
jgi:CRP-like cAMP-binding protein